MVLLLPGKVCWNVGRLNAEVEEDTWEAVSEHLTGRFRQDVAQGAYITLVHTTHLICEQLWVFVDMTCLAKTPRA